MSDRSSGERGSSARSESSAVPRQAPEPKPDPIEFDPADPFARWDDLSTAARVELLGRVVRGMWDRSRVT